MEIRLKIWELIIVTLGFFASGTILGMAVNDDFSNPARLLYSAGILIVSLTIIVRKRYKLSA
jgi:hypothetical protein